MPTHFASGFALPPMLSPDAPDTAFGHPGAGGSLGFADPASGLAFGYVMNQMQLGLAGDPRAERLRVGGLRVPSRRARRREAAHGSMITLPDTLASRAVSSASSKRASGKRCVIAGERSTSESMRTISA